MDGTPLAMVPDQGVAETHCHQCRRKYRFVRGVLVEGEVARGSAEDPRGTARLTIDTGDSREQLEDVSRSDRWKSLYKGRPITVTVEIDRDGEGRIVRVRNQGPPFSPHEPGDRASVRTVGIGIQGGIVSIFLTVLAVYFYHWTLVFLILPAAAVVTALCIWRWKTTSTRHRVEPLRLQQLEREQWLLGQLDRYRLQAGEVQKRLGGYQTQIAELEGLLAEMESASGDYSHRQVVIERGLEALRHHLDNDRKLQQAIAETMEMVEIEYKASRALDHLPDDAIDRLTHTIAELEAIEAENVALEAQLEANAEVHAIAPN